MRNFTPLSILLLLMPAHAALAQEPPNNVPLPLSIRAAVTTSAEGLVEEFAISGRVVRLQGRFRSLAMATLDENGEVTVTCHGPGDHTGHDHTE